MYAWVWVEIHFLCATPKEPPTQYPSWHLCKTINHTDPQANINNNNFLALGWLPNALERLAHKVSRNLGLLSQFIAFSGEQAARTKRHDKSVSLREMEKEGISYVLFDTKSSTLLIIAPDPTNQNKRWATREFEKSMILWEIFFFVLWVVKCGERGCVCVRELGPAKIGS